MSKIMSIESWSEVNRGTGHEDVVRSKVRYWSNTSRLYEGNEEFPNATMDWLNRWDVTCVADSVFEKNGKLIHYVRYEERKD